jgi:hypothetical protein
MHQPGPDGRTAPGWLLYARVADIDRAVARVEAGGGVVVKRPHEVPGGDRVARLLDPQGAPFALHQPRP